MDPTVAVVSHSLAMGFLLTPAAILLGCVALATRPPATISAFIVTLAVGVIGLITPVPRRGPEGAPSGQPSGRSDRGSWEGARRGVAAVALGVVAFAIARALENPIGPAATPAALAATVTAAVAEELFFRRLVYGWFAGLRGGGQGLAITGAAVLFACVHVPAYGVRILPLDFAAGLVFGWQRWASGTWTAPAVTHAVANVLQSL
jgi:membrane protease YdiL (CAAX protease family)